MNIVPKYEGDEHAELLNGPVKVRQLYEATLAERGYTADEAQWRAITALDGGEDVCFVIVGVNILSDRYGVSTSSSGRL